MSEYVQESGASTRARKRRRRSLITLAIVVALLFGAFWYAYSYYRNPPASAKPIGTCATTPKPPAKVTVNVYNATSKDGLASTTAGQLRKRGLTIGKVANDPLKKAIKGTAEVRYGPKGAEAAKVVAAQVTKPAMVKDKRGDASVDLVIGNGFTALATVQAPTATPTC